MKRSKWTIAIIIIIAPFILMDCKGKRKDDDHHNLPSNVIILEESNGQISRLSLEFHYQDIFHPRLAQLRIEENLDKLVSGGKNELERMRLLRDWVSNQWEPSTPDPYPVWDAVSILKDIRSKKTGGFCAQYAVLLVQTSISLGWQARYLAIATGDRPDNGHMTVEIWSNQFNKWIVMDPYFCVDYESNGEPLGALDIHRALVKDSLDEIKINFGKDRRDKSPGKETPCAQLLSYYSHLSFDLRNNHLTRAYSFWNRRQEYLSWRDSYTDGRPSIFSRFTSDENEFNFLLNQVEIFLAPGQEPDILLCHLRTNMPEMKSLLIRIDEGNWMTAPIRLALNRAYGSTMLYAWKLHPGHNSIQARAMNELGGKGPVSKIVLKLER